MTYDVLVERLFDALVDGERDAARAIVRDATGEGACPEDLLMHLFWPTYEAIERLYRADQMTNLAHNFATRLLRVLVDQAAGGMERLAPRARRVFASCGPTEADELSAQMAVHLLEREGFQIRFCGGGIASDELLEHIQSTRPDVLLLFASAPADLPEIRGLIDTLNEIGAVRTLQVVVGGGVFNRAEGLAAEIGADLWAASPEQLVSAMIQEPERRAAPAQHSVGRKRKTRAAA